MVCGNTDNNLVHSTLSHSNYQNPTMWLLWITCRKMNSSPCKCDDKKCSQNGILAWELLPLSCWECVCYLNQSTTTFESPKTCNCRQTFSIENISRSFKLNSSAKLFVLDPNPAFSSKWCELSLWRKEPPPYRFWCGSPLKYSQGLDRSMVSF